MGSKQTPRPPASKPVGEEPVRPALHVVDSKPARASSGSQFIDQLTVWLEGLEAEVERIRAL